MLKFQVHPAPFLEHPVTDATSKEINEYDIIIQSVPELVALSSCESKAPTTEQTVNGLCESKLWESKANLQLYCHSLLTKLLSLPKSRIKPFLQYQCEQLASPFIWLNKLEKLIDLNREQFTTKDHNIKIEKALMVIELLRNEIESGKLRSGKYNFKKVKDTIQKYQTPEEKMSYLLEQKTEYLQNKPLLQDPTEVPFDIQCDLEMNLLKTKRKLHKTKTNNTETTRNIETKERDARSLRHSKGRINTNVNVFVDIFYQLLHEKKIDGKPALEASTGDLVHFISEHFADRDGCPIPANTIKMILKPSQIEKRPKGDKRFQFTLD